MASRRLTRRQTRKLLEKAGLNSSSSVIKPNTASVYVTDYEGGGSKIVKTETSPTTGQTRITTIRAFRRLVNHQRKHNL